MGVGGGAHWQALAHQVKRSQARIQGQILKRRMIRDANRRALMSKTSPESLVPQRASFDCHYLCLDCGYLAPIHTTECPACGQRGLVDVGDNGMHELLVGVDRDRRSKINERFKIGLYGTITAGLFAISWVVVFAMYGFPSRPYYDGDLIALIILAFLNSFAALALAYPVYSLTLRPVVRLFHRRQPEKPVRWHGPVALHERQGSTRIPTESGVVWTDENLLISPLTGEPCVAYRIIATLETPEGLSPCEIALDECLAVSFSVNGVLVNGQTVLVETAPVTISRGESQDETRLETFLRRRGVHEIDGSLAIRQALVRPGDFVVVERTTEGDLSFVAS